MILDGALGVILEIHLGRCHIVWEDRFSSWEMAHTLHKAEESLAADSLDDMENTM